MLNILVPNSTLLTHLKSKNQSAKSQCNKWIEIKPLHTKSKTLSSLTECCLQISIQNRNTITLKAQLNVRIS